MSDLYFDYVPDELLELILEYCTINNSKLFIDDSNELLFFNENTRVKIGDNIWKEKLLLILSYILNKISELMIDPNWTDPEYPIYNEFNPIYDKIKENIIDKFLNIKNEKKRIYNYARLFEAYNYIIGNIREYGYLTLPTDIMGSSDNIIKIIIVLDVSMKQNKNSYIVMWITSLKDDKPIANKTREKIGLLVDIYTNLLTYYFE